MCWRRPLRRQCELEFVDNIADLVESAMRPICRLRHRDSDGGGAIRAKPVYRHRHYPSWAFGNRPGFWAERCWSCATASSIGRRHLSGLRCSKSLLNGPCGGSMAQVRDRMMWTAAGRDRGAPSGHGPSG